MKSMYLALGWLSGAVFLLLGVSVLFVAPLAGLCLLGIAALLLPPAREFLHSKTGRTLSGKARALAILVLLIAASLFTNQSQRVQEAEREEQQAREQSAQAEQARQEAIGEFERDSAAVLASIEALIVAEDFDAALARVERYLPTGDARLQAVHARVAGELEAARRAAGTRELLDALEALPEDDDAGRQDLYRQLAVLNPDTALYREREAFHSRRIEEAERKRAEQEARRIANAVRGMRKTTDRIEGIDWYRDRSSPAHTNANAFLLYFGKRGEGAPWLRLRIQYLGEDWLFIESFIVVADGQRFDRTVARFERDHDHRIWEWYDENATAADLQMIRAIIDSSEAVIRFNGRQYRKDRTITSAQKAAMRNVLDAYAALGGVEP